MLVLLLLIIIIFSNQYLLINEEFFIILGFLFLCYIVKSNLGSIVENELLDRKNRVLQSYLEYLKKKSKFLKANVKTINDKVEYLFNYQKIQHDFFFKYSEMFLLLKQKSLLDLNKSLESGFIYYFANLVSNKRKFL